MEVSLSLLLLELLKLLTFIYLLFIKAYLSYLALGLLESILSWFSSLFKILLSNISKLLPFTNFCVDYSDFIPLHPSLDYNLFQDVVWWSLVAPFEAYPD